MATPHAPEPQPPSPWVDIALFAAALLIVALASVYLITET